MFGFVRILLILGILVVGVSAVTVGWPMVSGSPRPQALETVARIIRGTPLEKRLSDVLGTSTDSAQSGLSRASSGLVNGFSGFVSDRIGVAVGAWTVDQILPVYDSLPQAKKQILQETICSSKSATGSAD